MRIPLWFIGLAFVSFVAGFTFGVWRVNAAAVHERWIDERLAAVHVENEQAIPGTPRCLRDAQP